MPHPSTNDRAPGPRFFTVAEAAALLKVSEVTIYRGISAGEFPAVKIRGRYAIPSRAIDDLEATALEALARRDLVRSRGEW